MSDDDLILNGILSEVPAFPADELMNVGIKPAAVDLIQSENDFIDAYNALTRSTPLPSVDNGPESAHVLSEKDSKRDMYDVNENYTHSNITNTINNKPEINTPEILTDFTNLQLNVTQENQFHATPSINGYPKKEVVTMPPPSNENLIPDLGPSNVSTNLANPPINLPIENILIDNSNDLEYALTENSNESLSKIATDTVAKHAKENHNRKINVESNSKTILNQKLEKTSNLNDIVGNTQRLIQQMRDEINSDINSIDSNNVSQSEADSSSNESDISSEHESSYSDTEDKETDEVSSNESETDSGTGSEISHLHDRRPTIIHRTSSEENDQFEEAMDHIEDQMEDFKNTNIEILDSIARSLQEEHNISVQITEPIMNDNKRHDLNNNNLFVEVNSFEEIYAELNTNKKEIPNPKDVQNSMVTKISSSERTDTSKAKITKQFNEPSNLETVDPTEQSISRVENIEVNRENTSENNIPGNAEDERQISSNEQNNSAEDDTQSNSSEEDGSLDSAESEIATNSQNILLIQQISSVENIIKQNIISVDDNATELNVSNNTNIDENVGMDNIKEPYLDAIKPELNDNQYITEDITVQHVIIENNSEQVVAEGRMETFIAVDDNIEQKAVADNTEPNITFADYVERNETVGKIESNITIPDNAEDTIIKTDVIENNIAVKAEIEAKLDVAAENDEPAVEQNTKNPETEMAINKVDEQNQSMEKNTLSEDYKTNQERAISVETNNTHTVNGVPENGNRNDKIVTQVKKKSPSKSPPKTPTDNSSNKGFISNIKSNIPKLVKVVQNNKQKVDKSPKVVASKVPVRRASIKQYPAPTPPKTHFGNVQSGHVKQLQTRLFNNKFPKTAVTVPDVIDVKPSTSTMHKKKPAPAPPTLEKQQTLTKASPPKEKKNSFFRESCRTEDEWTESEAEDGPPPAPREPPEPGRAPSPPPPVTVRKVSGQIIDLAKVRLPEGSPERQARMLLAEGATETWEQACLAVELVSLGAAPPAALLAALECADLPAALAYLHQDCELCAERLPEHEMVSMLRCTHRCCRECARLYFTVQVSERSIADCVCPYCKEPDLEAMPEDAWLEYFAHLDILLKALLEPDVHELFQRKLRDRTLARDPNFRWCMECSSGFFVHPKQKKIRCPECRSVSCAKCRKTWSVNHEGLSCEQYTAWLEDNDPERSIAAVQQHLRENGLECPRCRFKYSLSRGGCMHFTCTQCKYEFCYGCGKPFTMGARCGLSEYCAKLGLHAHHPRNCLFYLRDKEPHELQTLLQMNNVDYETKAPEGSTNRCPIQLQRETPTGLVDGTCNSEAPPNYAGLCKPHYVELLAARARSLDPIPIMDVSELVAELRRRALPLPERGPWDTDPVYAGMCAEIVREKIPLE